MAISAGVDTAGTQSLLKRLHHHRAADYDDSPTTGRTTTIANKETGNMADFLEDEYPSDFRWPESYFDLEASSDVAVVVGQTAFLVCRVAVAGNWTVRPYFIIQFYFNSVFLEVCTLCTVLHNVSMLISMQYLTDFIPISHKN